MFSAIGYSQTLFYPTSPDRLCRGRERWISFETDPSEESMHRTVVSGARFSDTSARDARRGVRCAGLGIGDVAMALFPGERVVAWAEEASCNAIPENASGIERFQLSRPQKALLGWYARWELDCGDAAAIEAAVSAGADVLLVGPAVSEGGEGVRQPVPPLLDDSESPALLSDELRRELFYLTGSRLGGDSFCLFQSLALPGLAKLCKAVVLLHRDKHELCMGVYSAEPVPAEAAVSALCEESGCMAVPFSIPPMLARWDRAIWDLRDSWDTESLGPFPVPARSRSRSDGDAATVGGTAPTEGTASTEEAAAEAGSPPEESPEEGREAAPAPAEEVVEPSPEA